MSEQTVAPKKPWYKSKLGKIGIVAALFIIFISMASSDAQPDNGPVSNTVTESSESSEPKTAKIGEPARDGKFEFTILSIDCGEQTVGSNPYLTKTAQGQYCLVSLKVKNIGDESQSLFSSNQKLFNKDGQEYSADDTATIYASPGSESWYSNINPGNSVEGVIVFDIPKDQTPVKAELHDSAFSGGVEVHLE